ncbi:putative thiol:disulfide interchange protein [Waddlia chondrophila 2032/99]|uniref:Putative thiol:disulfide interchange protein n=2 Tax=Waddlia chondrophila TaxID=71667 RepID=D6YTN0_WADCW|nr:protein-disulfide reductase DsbD domain-containing protein [Waddlia chondrophila]ADI37491.1 putative thiol:disulfide interchange protein [Waddlia chondrophila WSU 86-1044]CCB90494.1 putative thiol:disulfide interchange protein [Waddlia chondrophila 2032/99]
MVTQIKKYIPVFLTLFAIACFAQESFDHFQDPVQAELIYESRSIRPDTPFWVGVRLKLDDGWHAYWKNPGDAGMPPQIEWTLPEGFSISDIQWPSPKKFTAMEAIGFGYEDEVILLAKVTPAKTDHSEIQIEASISWVVCDSSSCLPGSANVKSTLAVSTDKIQVHDVHAGHFEKARSKLPKAMNSLKGERKNGLICIPIETSEKIVSANFYPEQEERIDISVDPVIADDATILLKEQGSSSKDPLKGVLVLNGKDAYEIYVSLDPHHSTDVAMNLNNASYPAASGDAHKFSGSLWLAIALAFLGGLILNCMPCVLPVISFKILSFVKMAGESRRLIFQHGLAFSFGVLLSFWVLAGVLLMLQSWGQSVGWGFQLQEPLFVGILAAIILIFGLSLFGVFEIGTGMASAAGQATTKSANGLTGSFLSGILATAVATPCTGPFLGTAVGFAVTLPIFQALTIFTSLGLGMASPYLLLGAFPNLLRWMPKPGNWMITFKEIMGFIMLATVLWLIWVFGAQTDTMALFILLIGFFFLAIGCWIWGKWGTPVMKKRTRMIGLAAASATFIIGGYAITKASSMSGNSPAPLTNAEIAMAEASPSELTDRWIPFSPELLEKLQDQGIPVFIDFTAKWCLICQANHLVLEVDNVEKKFLQKGVVRMIGDWTKSDPVITEWLKKFGRNGVPLYVLYNEKREVEVLPQVLTPDLVIEKLDALNL